MAEPKKWTLLQPAIDAEQAWLVGDKQAGDEFDHDFETEDTERAVIAAGWVEPADTKGGKK
jgi:hypothetical protein